jgi:hypothetical protein
MFVALGTNFFDVDPGKKLYVPDLKIDTQKALNISQEFQCLLEDAETRLENMEELQRITKEKLTDRLNALDNVITSEMARWEKRYLTTEKSSELKMESLKDRLSDKTYRLKDKRRKDEAKAVAKFAKDTVEIERFFAKIVEDIKGVRTDLASKSLDTGQAVEKYRTLVDALDESISNYRDVTASTNDIADEVLQQALDMDDELVEATREEEEATSTQINELQDKLVELKEEMNEKQKELDQLKAKVSEAVDKIDGIIDSRLEDLQLELKNLRALALGNETIKGLAPLTQLNISTYVVNYNKGKPLVFTPIIVPEDRFGLPFEHEPLDPGLEEFIRKAVKKQLKDSPSFKASFEKTCTEGNIFQFPELTKIFTKGVNSLFNRQLLKEGVRETLQTAYVTLAGRCPECKAEIAANAKFCPSCGTSVG